MPRNKGFTLVELLIVIVIIGILATIGIASFSSSQMKSRDTQRKANLKQIANALEIYYNDKGQYPAGNAGQMMGCGAGAILACSWGSSTTFSNTTTGTVYMARLPTDPSSNSYYYRPIADPTGLNTKYQLYARIENTQDKNIITTDVSCGTALCNYGVSSGNTTP